MQPGATGSLGCLSTHFAAISAYRRSDGTDDAKNPVVAAEDGNSAQVEDLHSLPHGTVLGLSGAV